MSKKIIVGKFGRIFGINGYIKVHSFTYPADNILSFKPWFVCNKSNLWQKITIEKSEIRGGNIIVKLPLCETPEEAKIYTNLTIAIERSQLPVLPPNEFYKVDFEGLQVINTKGIKLGIVKYVLETGANDVLIITANNKEIAIPYIKKIILEINLKQNIIIVNWDED